jgi:hypothetical protein
VRLTDAQASNEHALAAKLVELVSGTAWLIDALRVVNACVESPWCIGAGTVRGLVWDHLHGHAVTLPEDVDVAFFEARANASLDRELAERLTQRLPGLRWDVVNQANAHLFSGNPEALPFLSLDDAVAAWPETATAVGVWWEPGDGVRVLAPWGLADLFDGVLRASPKLRDPRAFLERCRAKRWLEKYPKVRLVQP